MIVILSVAKDLCTSRQRLGRIPLCTQVVPRRILRNDKSDLFNSQPSLDLFFPLNRIVDVLEGFKVDEAIEFIVLAEFRSDSLFVLPDASQEIVGNAGVKGL